MQGISLYERKGASPIGRIPLHPASTARGMHREAKSTVVSLCDDHRGRMGHMGGVYRHARADTTFPETLGYVVWAFVMIPPALVALWIIGWKVEYDAKSIFWGCVAGFLGAGGQLILFKTLRLAPAYLVFPFIALSPVVTIAMALILSKERATMKGWIGIVLAVVAGVSWRTHRRKGKASGGLLWVLLASLVLLAWGIQGFAISHANKSMKAESIFFYMMLTSVLLIPVALAMTDFTRTDQLGLQRAVSGRHDSNPQLRRGAAAGLCVSLRQGHHRFAVDERRSAGRHGRHFACVTA